MAKIVYDTRLSYRGELGQRLEKGEIFRGSNRNEHGPQYALIDSLSRQVDRYIESSSPEALLIWLQKNKAR